MPFLDIIESLKTREGRCRNCDDCSVCQTDCDVGVSGITITLQRQEEGMIFSYPYYKAYAVSSICAMALPTLFTRSLAILVQATVGSSGGWNWIKPFTWDLWLAVRCAVLPRHTSPRTQVCLTLIIFSLIVFLLEFLSLKPRLRWRDVPHGWNEANWRSIWTLMQGTVQVSGK